LQHFEKRRGQPLSRTEIEPVLSVVIPAYNEEGRIEPTLERVRKFLEERGEAAEVLVVDDGSRDETPRVVEAEMTRYRASGLDLRLLGDGANHGKGAAVRTGMLAARGHVVLFSDADLSAPIEEAPKLVDPILAGSADIAIGSRGLDKSLIGVHQSAGREYAGRFFNLLMRTVTGMPFKDTQCGFKAFRRDAARNVFSRVRIERFGFDVEVLYLARKLGYEALEVPVVWNNVEGSKVSLMGGLNGYLDLLRVRWNDLRGRYDGKASARSISTIAD
jgi:glycosyltransferase involved in cell wall biosynthesis